MGALTFNPGRSKTVLGLVVVVVGYLLQPEVLAVLPAQAAEGVRLVGAILAAIGLRDAATKPDAPASPGADG